jgi:hypothetical protein
MEPSDFDDSEYVAEAAGDGVDDPSNEAHVWAGMDALLKEAFVRPNPTVAQPVPAPVDHRLDGRISIAVCAARLLEDVTASKLCFSRSGTLQWPLETKPG